MQISPSAPDPAPVVLIVDDEPDMRLMLQRVVEKQCACKVALAASGEEALSQLNQCQAAVIVTDIKMPDMDGLTLLQRVRERDESISLVVMTGYGTIGMAVQALKDGAYDFLEKPFDNEHIIRVIRHGLERTRLLRVNHQLAAQLAQLSSAHGFIGHSPCLRQALELIERVADTDVTVLIRGESGTGKEGAALALHRASSRKDRDMVKVNCPALPEQILESELFGYAKGAFTGATRAKKGLFLEANGSTILLDEIADIPINVQTKLLRVLQEKEIQPLGQNNTLAIDVRVVASTNQDLETKMRAGEFREDLFYRLNVVTVTMPSLQEMAEDIPLLAHHFLQQFKSQYQRPKLTMGSEALAFLCQQSWPGNVRQLQNCLKRAVLLCPGEIIRVADIHEPLAVKGGGKPIAPGPALVGLSYKEAKEQILTNFSTTFLRGLLEQCQGNVTKAAKVAGLDRQGLQRLLRRYGIKSEDFR